MKTFFYIRMNHYFQCWKCWYKKWPQNLSLYKIHLFLPAFNVFVILLQICEKSSLSYALSVEPREAYFNGSAYLRLKNPMLLWGHSALSFRTCRGKFEILNMNKLSSRALKVLEVRYLITFLLFLLLKLSGFFESYDFNCLVPPVCFDRTL